MPTRDYLNLSAPAFVSNSTSNSMFERACAPNIADNFPVFTPAQFVGKIADYGKKASKAFALPVAALLWAYDVKN